MSEKEMNPVRQEKPAAADRGFKRAVTAFAIVELIVIVLVLYYKLAR